MRTIHIVRETITYPKVTVTKTYDPCHDGFSPFEHVLACRHLVTTSEPNEPCAPNCHHAALLGSRQAPKMTLSNALKKDFYCDACVEEQAGKSIYVTDSCKQAEKHRIDYRRKEKESRDKANSFRKCYIAQKVVSVPCDEDGYAVEDYDPYVSAHPFDTAWPPTGDNMFEDIDATPTCGIRTKLKKKKSLVQPQGSPEEAAIHINEAVAEDVDETVTEGEHWMQEEQERKRRRAAEGTPDTRRRRAVARSIVISPSPDTGMSSFVVDDSSLLTSQTETQDNTSTPTAANKKRDKKRKKVANDEAESTTTPAPKPKKRVKATSKAPSPEPGTVTSTSDARSRGTMQTGRISDVAHKKALERHRKRAAEDEAAAEPAVTSSKRTKPVPKTSKPAHGYFGPSATTGTKGKSATSSKPPAKSIKKTSKRVCTVL